MTSPLTSILFSISDSLSGVQKHIRVNLLKKILDMSSREKNIYQIHPYTFQQTNQSESL